MYRILLFLFYGNKNILMRVNFKKINNKFVCILILQTKFIILG